MGAFIYYAGFAFPDRYAIPRKGKFRRCRGYFHDAFRDPLCLLVFKMEREYLKIILENRNTLRFHDMLAIVLQNLLWFYF